MKKIFVCFFLYCFICINFSYAEKNADETAEFLSGYDEEELQDIEAEPIMFAPEEKNQKKTYKLKINKYAHTNLKKDSSSLKYDGQLLSEKINKNADASVILSSLKLRNVSINTGGKYSSDYLNPNSERTVGLFSKYKYKKFTLNTEYTNSSDRSINNPSEKIKFAPEYNLTDRFSVKYIYNKDINKDSYQNGVGIRYRPKLFSDSMEFSADMKNKISAQKDYSCQFNFETKIRW